MTQVMETDDFLAHFGVKGMKWGVRKERSSSDAPRKGLSRNQKIAIAGGVVAVGATAAAVVLGHQGKLPTHELSVAFSAINQARNGNQAAKVGFSQTQRRMESGVSAANKMAWDKLVKDMHADIANAHQNETTQMLKIMSGLGTSYNPRANEFTPEARRLQIGR